MSGSSSTIRTRAISISALETDTSPTRHALADLGRPKPLAPQNVESAEGVVAGHRHPHPDPEVQHPLHLLVCDCAKPLDLAEDAGHLPRTSVYDSVNR